MVFVSAINMNSAMLVRDELQKCLAHTVQTAEQLVPGEASTPTSALIAELSQISGILRILELDGAVELSATVLALAQRLDDPVSPPVAEQIETLKRGLSGLQCYVEYCFKHRQAHPLAVNGLLNELRAQLRQSAVCEAQQLNYTPPPRSASAEVSPAGAEDQTPILADELPRIKRLQHMYQLGLLGVLRGNNQHINLRLMACAVDRLQREFVKLADRDWWLLIGALLCCFARAELRVTPVRRRLLTAIDAAMRNRLRDGGGAPISLREDQIGEILCLLQLAGEGSASLAPVRGAYVLSPPDCDDRRLAQIESALVANNDQLLNRQGQVLRDELYQAKELLNKHGESLDQQAVSRITTHMQRVGELLGEAGFSRLKGMLADRVLQLAQLLVDPDGDERETLSGFAEALLIVESTLTDPDNFSDHALADQEPGIALLARRAREEAIGVVLNESKAAIQLAKRGITAYLESNFDLAHIANVGTSLGMVQGAFELLEYRRASQVLGLCIDFVNSQALGRASEQRSRQAIETLADALISIEYYLDELAISDCQNEELLAVAEDSVAELGKAA